MPVYKLNKHQGETLDDIELEEDEEVVSSAYVGGGTERIETEVRPYGCDECEKSFKSQEALSGHMSTHSDNDNSDSEEDNDE